MLRFALHFLFFLSGTAALGYQLVWSKMFSTALGHEMPAVLAIVCAFMAGMALGASTVDRFIPRDTRAGLWLSVLELTIGAWAIVTSFLIPHVNEFALGLIGAAPSAMKHWTIAFITPALILLPATMAMGATFPAMEKFLSVLAPKQQSIGSVYAANTFGAVAGTLIAPYVLMPALGLSKSGWILAAINAVVALGALFMARPSWNAAPPATESAASLNAVSSARLGFTFFVTGLLGIGYEAAGVRVLSQVLKNTVFTYAAVLSVFLVGTAIGAAAYHHWWRKKDPRRLLATLLCATALACFAGMLLMTRTPAFYLFVRRLGDSRSAVLLAELLTSAVAFVLPTFCMGATFSHLVQLARAQRGHIGSAVALNTLGAALAPLLTGVILIPLIGAKWTLLLAGLGYALLLPAKPNLKIAAPALLTCIITVFTNLCIISVPPGGNVISYREGVMGSVAVIDEGKNRTLRVDNSFQMGGTGSADAEYRQAHLPLLLHPAPHHALFLGLGTGISFGASSLHPNLETDGVELVPEVVEAMHFFAPQNFSPQEQPNLRLHVADARRFIRTQNSSENYDVIIGDLFHPYRDGAGALYTREHFAAIHRRLAPDGVFCQWLPLFQMDEMTLRVITRTFLAEFPQGEAWLLRFNVDTPVIGLIASSATRWSSNRVESIVSDSPLAAELKRLGLANSLRLYGHLLVGAAELRAFSDAAPVNTDDNQRVTFIAARVPYEREVKPYTSLLSLLTAAKDARLATLHLPEGDFAEQFSQYIIARNVYLRGLIHDAENERDAAINDYIESARLSPDFTTGYAQCITIANVIANSDPSRARRILEALDAVRPERPVAKELLQRLFP